MLLDEWIDDRVHHDLRTPGVLGWAWATVDLERALSEAGEHARREWVPVEDELLGARGLRLLGVEPAVILLEPSTEGRLAGWLARYGEGEAAIYREGALNRDLVSIAPNDPPAVIQRPRMTALGRSGRLASTDARSVAEALLEVLIAPAT